MIVVLLSDYNFLRNGGLAKVRSVDPDAGLGDCFDAYLAFAACFHAGEARFSIETLCKETGRSEEDVIAALKFLQERSAILEGGAKDLVYEHENIDRPMWDISSLIELGGEWVNYLLMQNRFGSTGE